jgi:Tfp pilus assembly protein PilF
VRGAEPEGGSFLRPLTKWLPGGDEQPKPKSPPRTSRSATPASGKPLSAEDLEQSKLALAQLAERRGSGEEAEKLFRSVLEKNPRQPLAHHRLGVLSAKRGDYAAADKHFEAALAQSPANVDLLNDWGYCLFLQHRLDEAEGIVARPMSWRRSTPPRAIIWP